MFYFILTTDTGGINMNEFEKDPAKKTNDVPHAVQGFLYSFIFFTFIFFLGTAISILN